MNLLAKRAIIRKNLLCVTKYIFGGCYLNNLREIPHSFFYWSKWGQTVPGVIFVAEFWDSPWENFSNSTEVLGTATQCNSSAFALSAFLKLAVQEAQSCINQQVRSHACSYFTVIFICCLQGVFFRLQDAVFWSPIYADSHALLPVPNLKWLNSFFFFYFSPLISALASWQQTWKD